MSPDEAKKQGFVLIGGSAPLDRKPEPAAEALDILTPRAGQSDITTSLQQRMREVFGND